MRDPATECVGLEQLPEAIDLLELRGVELGDCVSTPRPVGHEAFPGERPQRFPHRNQAHPGPLRPGLLVDALARAQLAVEDGGPQRRRRAILRGRRAPRSSTAIRLYRNAGVPVRAPPTTSVCTSCVPS